jgi:hypothetical protein
MSPRPNLSPTRWAVRLTETTPVAVLAMPRVGKTCSCSVPARFGSAVCLIRTSANHRACGVRKADSLKAAVIG